MGQARLAPAQVEGYHRDGYLLLDGYFPAADMAQLLRVARADQELAATAADRLDSEGRVSRLSLRFDLSEDDAYRAYARCRRIVEAIEQLLGAQVYHYHHKMMMKQPFSGGAWEWHQDFGYWYGAFLFPHMASCMIAVDRANRANGCLQVLKGSHEMGRLDHGRTGDQTGTDAARMAVVAERFDLVYCEMEPGAVLFFDSNLLHRSDANRSPDPRWALICCYTAAHNKPFTEGARGVFEPFERWDDGVVRTAVARHEERLAAAQRG